MGKIKGFVIGAVAGVLALTACGENEGVSAPEESVQLSSSSIEVVSNSSSSEVLAESSAEAQPESSSEELPGSSSNSSSSSEEVNISSSSEQPPLSSSCEPFSSSSIEKVYPQYNKILGADISQAQELEAKGVKFFDVDGREKDLFVILRDHGFNYIRLKTFVDPKAEFGYASDGCDQGFGEFPQNVEAFGDKEHVVAYAKRAKALGFKLLLDFHYSDNWADPGKQIIPERWRNISNSNVLADSVYSYTKDVLNALKAVGALPEMVQVGNEITNGMLREVPSSNTDCWGNKPSQADGAVNGGMGSSQGIANTAKYLAAGARAVKEISNNIKVVFHIESPHKTNTVEWWMKSIIMNSKVVPDVMAFSAYTAYEHGNPDSWKKLMIDLGKTYNNLEFMIAEYNGASKSDYYAYDGSRAKTHQIMDEIPRGIGAFIWEPERSGAWGTAMFDWVGNNLKANAKAFDEYKVLFR